MTTTTDKILERAAHYERLAAALRLAAHELNGHLVEKKQQAGGVGAMLSAAVQLREEQREQVSARRPKPAHKASYASLREKVATRKNEIKALLQQAESLSATEVRARLGETVTKSRIGQILAELGARKVGTGQQTRWTLVRGVGKKAANPKKPKQTVAMVQARRRRSAAILAKFDATEPRPLVGDEQRKASGLLRRGYLRKKADGYVRTGKEFVV